MDFETAVAIVLDHEGGYVNDLRDPGGETNYGIAKRHHPGVDIKNLTKKQAADIYKEEYWKPMSLDSFPPQLRLIIFDCAVNQGVARAKGFCCTALGLTRFEKATPELFNIFTKQEIDQCILKIAHLRLNHYASLATWNTFGKGWMSRLLHVSIKSALK